MPGTTTTYQASGIFSNTLSVASSTTLNTSLSVGTYADIKTTLSVGGATELKSTLSVGAAATMAASLSVGTFADIKTTLSVGGATELKSTLSVGAAATMAASLSVGTFADIKTTLSVGGAATLKDNLSVGGTFTLNTAASDPQIGKVLTCVDTLGTVTWSNIGGFTKTGTVAGNTTELVTISLESDTVNYVKGHIRASGTTSGTDEMVVSDFMLVAFNDGGIVEFVGDGFPITEFKSGSFSPKITYIIDSTVLKVKLENTVAQGGSATEGFAYSLTYKLDSEAVIV